MKKEHLYHARCGNSEIGHNRNYRDIHTGHRGQERHRNKG